MALIPKNPQSVEEIFMALVQIPSPSKKEKGLIVAIADWLDSHGRAWSIDEAANITGGDTGNLIVHRGNGSGKKVLFVAHVDTVQEVGQSVEPVIREDFIYSKGPTILGADNKAAVAALLYLCAQEQQPTEADAIIAFTTSEESGTMGAKALSNIAEQISYAFPVDGSEPVGTMITKALGHQPFEIQITGRKAHAAKNPEEGLHAIKTASSIVASLPLGRSPEFIVNIGRIEGGGETNIIPDEGVIFGEVRSYSHQGLEKGLDLIRRHIETAVNHSGAKIDLVIDRAASVPPFSGENNQACQTIARQAAREAGITGRFISCPATFEANILDSFGLPTLGISSGGENPHSEKERLSVTSLQQLPDLLAAVLRQAKAFSS